MWWVRPWPGVGQGCVASPLEDQDSLGVQGSSHHGAPRTPTLGPQSSAQKQLNKFFWGRLGALATPAHQHPAPVPP